MIPLRIATRSSPLALVQARAVAALLGGETELVEVTTRGDRLVEAPLSSIGGTGAFSSEVQAAVLEGRADLAVHSAKDLPPQTLPGLCLAAVPERCDPRDALVGGTLDTLVPGARVLTGSPRRRAQIAALRPDLTWGELRGNIATRLAKIPPGGAVVMALAALVRLGLADRADEVFEVTAVLPQVGQGALAVECRDGDAATAEILARIDHLPTRRAVDAERAFLSALGGDCELPVGAFAVASGGSLRLEAVVASADGHIVIRESIEGNDPGGIGRALAESMAEHLDSCGAGR